MQTSKIERPMERGIRSPRSLTRESWELLPVMVVQDLRLSSTFWFTSMIPTPIRISTRAITYPQPGFNPQSVRYNWVVRTWYRTGAPRNAGSAKALMELEKARRNVDRMAGFTMGRVIRFSICIRDAWSSWAASSRFASIFFRFASCSVNLASCKMVFPSFKAVFNSYIQDKPS